MVAALLASDQWRGMIVRMERWNHVSLPLLIAVQRSTAAASDLACCRQPGVVVVVPG